MALLLNCVGGPKSCLITQLNIKSVTQYIHKGYTFINIITRIVGNIIERETYLQVFKSLEIMTFQSLYVYYCLISVKENVDFFIKTEEMYINSKPDRKIIWKYCNESETFKSK